MERDIPFLKQYSVFNVEQCEGLPDRFYEMKIEPKDFVERIASADQFYTGRATSHVWIATSA